MNRTVLVTGAAGGIGRAVVATFAAAGWSVAATDAAAGAQIPGAGDVVVADLGTPPGIEAVAAALRRAGRLDALVNNAAVQIPKALAETTVDEWDRTMAVNVRAAFLLSQAALPLLRATAGSIINVASVHALATSGKIAAYAASKGALVALTRAMAIEFGPTVRVNAVLPGAIDTPMLRAGLERGHVAGGGTQTRLDALAARTVLGRVGTPRDVAEAVVFLADPDRSGFITGQLLAVDGGATARLSTE